MNLNNIKKTIEKKGYIVVLRENETSWLQCSIPIIDFDKRIIAFGIMIIDNKISLWDASKQVAKNITFNSTKELTNYIDENFRIQE